MNDCKKKCECNCEKALHGMKYEIVTDHNILMTILGKHIHDAAIHVSEDDRRYWNSKADREAIVAIENSIKERVEEVSREVVESVVHEVIENVSHEVVENVTHEIVEQPLIVDWNYKNYITANAVGRTRIGTLTINGSSVDIFQKDDKESNSESSSTTPSEGGGYDDTEIRNLIASLRTDLNSIHNWSQQQIDAMVREIVEGYNFVDGTYDGWIDEDGLRRYLITNGILKEDGSKAWAYLEIKYNEVRAAVDALNVLQGEDGEPINYEALQSIIDARINGRIAELNLNTKWALLDADHEELEWMMSGFRSQASQYNSFAEMYSTGLTQNNDALTAGILTEVNNRIATAKTEIGAQVNSNLAGYVAYSDLDHAVATMFADNGESTAYISTAVENGISNATIDADKVYVNGQTLVNYLNENSYDAEGVTIEQSSITVDRNMDEDGDAVVITPGSINVSNHIIDQHDNTITPSEIQFSDPTVGTTTYSIAGISATNTYDLSSGITFDGDGVMISGSISTQVPGDGVYSTISGDYEISPNLYLHVKNGLIVAIDNNSTL